MVGHEADGVAGPVAVFIDVGNNFKNSHAVPVVFAYGFFVIAPARDALHRAWVFAA